MDKATRALVKKVRAKSLARARLIEIQDELNRHMRNNNVTLKDVKDLVDDGREEDKPIAVNTLRRLTQYGRGGGYYVYHRGPTSDTLLGALLALGYDVVRKSNK